MKFKLVLIVATVYFAGCAFAQTTDAPESDKSPTCPPEPTCPPVEPEKCTCPPVVECPTTESTRTRTRTRGPSRTPRTQERTNSTDTDRSRSRPGPGGRSRTDTRRDQTRTDERSNRTRTDTHRTRPRRRLPKPPRDCTPRLPPGCKDYIATTGPLIFTTATTSSPPPYYAPSACSSSVIDATGKRQIPMIALQFYVSESNPFTFASEALDFAEVITLLASESIGVDTVNAAVLGISAQENGLSALVAVSFNTTANNDYTQTASQIVDTLYGQLDQLGEYYHVTNMRTVRMVAQYYSPSSVAIKPKSNLSSSTVATVTVSTLALIGMLATVVVLTVKLSKRLSQQSKEKEPLLEDRVDERRTTVM